MRNCPNSLTDPQAAALEKIIAGEVYEDRNGKVQGTSRPLVRNLLRKNLITAKLINGEQRYTVTSTGRSFLREYHASKP